MVYSPNTRVKPIVSSGEYTHAAHDGLDRREKARIARLPRGGGHERRLLRYADGHRPRQRDERGRVAQRISGSYYAIGFRDDGSTVMGKPSLRITAQTDLGRSLTVTALNYVRQSVVRHLPV